MSKSTNLLTKSKFKLAAGCPRKLFYAQHPSRYMNFRSDDPFTAELAEGGHQVAEYVRLTHPGGVEISSLNSELALKQTEQLLNNADEITIFEAALKAGNFLARVDVLTVKGDEVTIYEVKSKAWDPEDSKLSHPSTGSLNQKWRPYLLDIAFQRHVAKVAFPNKRVTSFLTLLDKSKEASTSGLNNKFPIDAQPNRSVAVEAQSVTDVDMSPPLIVNVPCDEECDYIEDSLTFPIDGNEVGFSEALNIYSRSLVTDKKLEPVLSSHCRTCEYRPANTDANPTNSANASGFSECWDPLGAGTSDDRLVIDLGDRFRPGPAIEDSIVFAKDIPVTLVAPKSRTATDPLSLSERRWLGVQSAGKRVAPVWVDRKGLLATLERLTFPLNFIDFETATLALPNYAGHSPHQQLAFQFSHHILTESGNLRHVDQYLCDSFDESPNYLFLRALKMSLEQNDGTILRYSAHENSVLCQLYIELTSDPNPPSDADELATFVKHVTHSSKTVPEDWVGDRDMVDLMAIYQNHYFDERTQGSCSLKYTLPAMLSAATETAGFYEHNLYGTQEIPSHNFTDHIWIQRDHSGDIINPYLLLPDTFSESSPDSHSHQSAALAEIRNGGSAMAAYRILQRPDLPNVTRTSIINALFRYCELDTLAMVLLYQGLVEAANDETHRLDSLDLLRRDYQTLLATSQ